MWCVEIVRFMLVLFFSSEAQQQSERRGGDAPPATTTTIRRCNAFSWKIYFWSWREAQKDTNRVTKSKMSRQQNGRRLVFLFWSQLLCLHICFKKRLFWHNSPSNTRSTWHEQTLKPGYVLRFDWSEIVAVRLERYPVEK